MATFIDEGPMLQLRHGESDAAKIKYILTSIKETGWTLGQFLVKIFTVAPVHNTTHHAMVAAFLNGQQTNDTAADAVAAMYDHSFSHPDSRHPEVAHYFSPTLLANEIGYCGPALSTWAYQLMLDEAGCEVDETCSSKKTPELRLRATRTQMDNSMDSGGLPAASDESRDLDLEPEEGEVQPASDSMDVDSNAESQNGDTTSVAEAPRGRRPKRRGATSHDALVSWSRIEDFSMHGLAGMYSRKMKVVWGMLMHLAHNASKGGESEAIYRPPEVVCASIISSLLYTRNHWVNFFPLCRGIALFATMAHQSAYRVGSRLGQNTPYTTTRNSLVTTAEMERAELKKRLENFAEEPVLVVFDNIQTLHRQRNNRIGTKNRMITGTGATAVEMEDCPPGAFNLAPIREKYEAGARREIIVDDIRKKTDSEHLRRVFAYHWLIILLEWVPALALYRSDALKRFANQTEKHQIDTKRHTKVHPLGTNGANETTTSGLREAIFDFLSQLGLTENSMVDHLMFLHGDGKSFEGIHKVKKLSSGKESDFFSWRFIHPVLELWHTKWTALSRIVRALWGPVGKESLEDPSTLGFMANAINSPKPSDLHKVEFYPNAHLINVVVRGHILHCYQIFYETDDLEAYFQTRAEDGTLPSLNALFADATILQERYSSTQAYWKARSACTPANSAPNDAPVGPAWSEGTVEGDYVLANSSLLMRDGLEFLEVCRATALGDIGRVLEVHKKWIFAFAGSGNSNYTAYMSEQFINLEYDFSRDALATRIALLNNYLVNLKGQVGHFHELDLMQEHFNFWLEELAQHKGLEFDSDFYRNVISMHIHQFLVLIQELEENVKLAARTTMHGMPPNDNEIREVIRIADANDLHRRREGRSYGFLAQDDYSEGYRLMGKKNKLGDYIAKTMEEWDNKHVQIPMPEGYKDMSTYMHVPISVDEDGEMEL